MEKERERKEAEEKADIITSNTGQEVEIKEVVITIK